jgi:enterochelin esterase-like enzyme
VQWDTIDPGSGLGAFNAVLTMANHAMLEGATHRESFSSFIEGNTRDVFVHLPPQYFATPSDRLPVIYNHDGREALTKGQFDVQVQAAIDDGTARPVMLVTVALDDQNQRSNEYVWDTDASNPGIAPNPRGDAYRRLMADELVPFIDSNYRTLADAADRVVAGQSLGGLISAYIAYGRPEVFGNAACQSASLFWNSNEMIQTVSTGAMVNVHWYLDSGTGSGTSDDNFPVTQQMWEALDSRGYVESHVTEQNGTHDWPHWAGRYKNIPNTFFPK